MSISKYILMKKFQAQLVNVWDNENIANQFFKAILIDSDLCWRSSSKLDWSQTASTF